MKRIKKSQMRYVGGIDGEELADNFNAAMNELAAQGIAVDERIISLDKLSAVLIFTVTEQYPENLKDKYALKGIFPTCGDCPYFERQTPYSGVCPYLKVKGKTAVHLDSFDICDKRWREIEEEVEYQRRTHEIPQFRSRAGQVGADETEAC